MIEKIYVTRDEVLHFPWLDSTKIDVCFDSSETWRIPTFRETVAVLMENGIKRLGPGVLERLNENSIFKVTGPSDISIIRNDKYLCISINEKGLERIVIAVCDWVLERNFTFAENLKEMGEFYAGNKESINSFFAELKKILTEKSDKNYRFFFQSMDGMN